MTTLSTVQADSYRTQYGSARPIRWNVTLLLTPQWFVLAGCLVFGLTNTGCQNSKNSLYEEIDHETPAHWPNDMADAADKIKSRLTIVASQPNDSTARSELVDLVSWCGEVAADTDIAEQQWQSIYDQCEAIRVQVNTGVAIETLEVDLRLLCDLLEAAHKALPTEPTL